MNSRKDAFTLVELMLATAVLSIIVVLLLSLANQASTIWRQSSAKIEQFRESRSAFETITTKLSQATLNTYWDYNVPLNPTRYERRSELRFISGPAEDLLGNGPDGQQRTTHAVFFQAPLGVTEAVQYRAFENLLSTWGYYLEYYNDQESRPDFLTTDEMPLRWRYRLMELHQPAEVNKIYTFTSGTAGRTYREKTWFRNAINSPQRPVRVVAENVIAMIIAPRLSRADEQEVRGAESNPDYSPLAPNYLYDTSPPATAVTMDGRINPQHQLPPMLQVTMVAIDEVSARRMNLGEENADHFELNSKFKKTANYSKDLLLSGSEESLEALLIKRRANYRIFSTNVVIRGAKWSTE
jgi:uncharacterized protein (TIGR02599 family)